MPPQTPLPARAPSRNFAGSQPDHAPVPRGESLDCLPRAVDRAVVDQNQLEARAGPVEHVGNCPMSAGMLPSSFMAGTTTLVLARRLVAAGDDLSAVSD